MPPPSFIRSSGARTTLREMTFSAARLHPIPAAGLRAVSQLGCHAHLEAWAEGGGGEVGGGGGGDGGGG